MTKKREGNFWKRRRAAADYECDQCGMLISRGNYHFAYGVPAKHRLCLMCAGPWDAADGQMVAALISAPFEERS